MVQSKVLTGKWQDTCVGSKIKCMWFIMFDLYMYIYRLQRDFALPCFAGVMRNAPPEPTVNTSQEKKVDFVSALK